jgi:hypothetical protein
MVMLIIFGFLFLIGFAFLVALMGSAFLKKHSVRMPYRSRIHPYGGTTGRGMPDQQVEQPRVQPSVQGYRDQHRETFTNEPGRQGPAPPPPMSPSMYPSKTSSGGGKVALVIPVIVVAIVLVLLFGLREFVGTGARPRLHFCEQVDFARLKPIHRSDTFTRGNVTLFVKSKSPLLLEKAYVEVYKLNAGGFEPYMDKELKLKPEWASFTIKALFDTVGSYMVSVYGKDETLLAQRNINIVPDSFGYRPVR